MVGVWDIASGEMTAVLRGHARKVVAVAYSPNGLHIVSGSDDMTVRIWLAPSKALYTTLEGHTDRISSVAFSPDSSTIASASHDGSVRLWAVQGYCIAYWQQHRALLHGIMCIRFSPDGRYLLLGSRDHNVRILDRKTGAIVEDHKRTDDYVHSLAYCPDGSKFVTGSYGHRLQRWDSRGCFVDLELTGHTAPVTSVSYSSDGKFIVSGSLDHTTRIWDSSTGDSVSVLKTGPVTSCAFSPNGLSLAIGLYDGTMRYVPDIRTITAIPAGDIDLDLSLQNTVAALPRPISFPPTSPITSASGLGALIPQAVNRADLKDTIRTSLRPASNLSTPSGKRSTSFPCRILLSSGTLFHSLERAFTTPHGLPTVGVEPASAKECIADRPPGDMYHITDWDFIDAASTGTARSRRTSRSSSSSNTLIESSTCDTAGLREDKEPPKAGRRTCFSLVGAESVDDESHGCRITCGWW